MTVVEALTEEECYLIAVLQDESGLDLAELTWYDPERLDGCWRAWAFQWAWFRSTDPLQIDQCLAEGTLILTERGQVPIEDVVVGDKVLTHTNRWKRVSYTWDRGEQAIVTLKGHGHPGLRTTDDHKFLTPDGGWQAPTDGSLWGSPSEFPPAVVPVLPERTYAPGRPSNIPCDVASPGFLWIYGLYLAEGSCSSSFGRNGTLNRTTFSVHTDEVAKVEAALANVGIRFNTQPVADEACFNIVVNSRPLAEWFTTHGGKGARSKEIAPWVLGLLVDQRRAVLDGAMFGDGYVARNEYTTASRPLAISIKLLGQSLGFSATFRSVKGRTSRIGDRQINGTQQYVVGLSRTGKAARIGAGSHWWSRVKSKIAAPTARCYDLEVEDDHSFIAEGIIVSNCARSVGKSQSVALRAFAFCFLHPGQEMVITAPEKVHLDVITDKIETQLYATRLTREMLVGGRTGIKHQPFHVNFANGSRIMGRIPQRDGKGVKGIHPIWLEMDEAQDYPKAGWTELIETLKRGHAGAVWRAHGVTRGVRDEFYKYTQPNSDWTVHRFTAMHRPTWTDAERVEKINAYGSKDHPDYRRNVLGLHGDATNPLFVLHRLMRCVDQDETSDYNQNEYFYVRINDETMRDLGLDIVSMIPFPSIHKQSQYLFHWIGMDVGYTNHPSEILVFGEVRAPKAEKAKLKLLGRVHLERIDHQDQVRAILHTIDFYRPKVFAMDSTGLGLPLYQDLQRQSVHAAKVIRGYNFSSKILVDFDATIDVDEFTGDLVKEAGIERNVLEYAQDCLRDYVDADRLILPWDRELIGQFQGGTQQTRPGHDQYGRRKIFSSGDDHALDAARMAALGHAVFHIDEIVNADRQDAVLDRFMM
jgi:hypothetical protein